MAGQVECGSTFETLLDIGPDLNPRAALGDKGYDSKSNRAAARQRGICPAITYRSNTKNMPAFFRKTLYKARARIEQAVAKLKRFKRIALRCEKTTQNYGSFVALALGFILIKSVHAAYERRYSALIRRPTKFSTWAASASRCPLRVNVKRIKRLACCHEQSVALGSAETNVGAALR